MSNESPEKKSQLLAVLREGISVVQMIVFKEVRAELAIKFRDQDKQFQSLLAGAITNELFGTPNTEGTFLKFREKNKATIEQELLSLKEDYPTLLSPLTDALRVQALCDNQDGLDGSAALARAKELGFLLLDRDVPLPSAFMTMVRMLGHQHNLIIPPVQISPEQDKIIH
ncbi:hypothetical protein [Desulfopila sp. IMCC35008]|uniref:hypothetical protein n=1 Tax=Desulfopila sp. IMCC35008 TaxID=2653858 RepID=UPI0013D49C9D|nr:hypothetical protein [Desulfopila sp. IMCC35008]